MGDELKHAALQHGDGRVVGDLRGNRLVRTGRSYGDKVEILTGLNPGENVIVEGVEKATDGGLWAGAMKDVK